MGPGLREPNGLRGAVSFLTRIPVDRGGEAPVDLGGSILWFPVVGALVGSVVGFAYVGARVVLPPPVAATLAVGLGVVLTGALHEDGLADTADALVGGHDREDILRILRDPAHGTYGVLAIMLSLFLRIGAVSILDAWEAVAALASAHALSRAASASLVRYAKPATEGGLAASYARLARTGQVLAGIVLALLVGASVLGAWLVAAALLTIMATAAVARLAIRKVGGITGDILGAAQQSAEVLVLLVVATVVTKGWGTIPWWRG